MKTIKIGEWRQNKYVPSTGEWINGESISFDSLSKEIISHCNTEQQLSHLYGKNIKLKMTSEWGNQTFFDICLA